MFFVKILHDKLLKAFYIQENKLFLSVKLFIKSLYKVTEDHCSLNHLINLISHVHWITSPIKNIHKTELKNLNDLLITKIVSGYYIQFNLN